MPNNYFKFKQFTIFQDNCAMKVGTDGVLLGAWVNTQNCINILDIGTGTGLIALMLAQKSEANIVGIEINKDAFTQAQENISSSKFSSKITLTHSSLQKYISKVKFDLIVSNPPFYQHHLQSDDVARNTARHSQELTYSELIKNSSEILSNNGRFCVIIPTDDKNDFITICDSFGLFLNNMLNIKTTPTKHSKRVLLEFSFNNNNNNRCDEKELIIEEFGRHLYSKKYIELTKDYYLDF